MATRSTFTPEEWATISQAPVLAGVVIMTSGSSGPIEAIQEFSALTKAIFNASEQPEINPLLADIIATLKASERPEAPKFDSLEHAHVAALDHLRHAAIVIDARAPEDAANYKHWLTTIGQRVAEAAREGGFLGFGGVQITQEESIALAEMRSALGI